MITRTNPREIKKHETVHVKNVKMKNSSKKISAINLVPVIHCAFQKPFTHHNHLMCLASRANARSVLSKSGIMNQARTLLEQHKI